MSKSTELTLGDDGDSGAVASPQQQAAAAAAALGISDAEPPFWSQQLNKASNVIFNSGVVALLRAWTNPPRSEAAAAGVAGVPEWYADEWSQRTRMRMIGTRVAKDTAAFAAGTYLMDAVEAGMCEVRGGKKDFLNKVMGGAAAGGLIGYAWYPTNPQARSLVTVAGIAVGYVTHAVEQTGSAILLKKQKELERDLLHKPEDQLRPELNQYYLTSLLRAKQLQLAEAARHERAGAVQEQQRDLVMPPAGGGGSGAPGGGGGRFFGDNVPYGRADGDDGGGTMTQDYPAGDTALAAGGDGARSWPPAAPAAASPPGRGQPTNGWAPRPQGTVRPAGSQYGSSSTASNDRGTLVIAEEEED